MPASAHSQSPGSVTARSTSSLRAGSGSSSTHGWSRTRRARSIERRSHRADLILVTHGHFDHIGDLVPVARATGATVIGIFELCSWLGKKGVQNTSPMNIGGSQRVGDITITMMPAVHSSAFIDEGVPVYLGEAAGYVIRFEDGLTAYFAGDTALFGDMRLIKEMYEPSSRFCRSATISRWVRRRRRARPPFWSASRRSCRCTTARFRS